MIIGISLSSLEKAFRLVDYGPHPENKEEVYEYQFWIICQLSLLEIVFIYNCGDSIYLQLVCIRLSNTGSFGGTRQSLGDSKMVKSQRAQVRHMLLLTAALSLVVS